MNVKIFDYSNVALIGNVISIDEEKNIARCKDLYYVIFDPKSGNTYLQRFQVYAKNLFDIDLSKVLCFSEPAESLMDYYLSSIEKYKTIMAALAEKLEEDKEKVNSIPSSNSATYDLETLDPISTSIN